MNDRERVSLEHGAVKMFLLPDEVALLISCITWVQLDLKIAEETLEKLNSPITEAVKTNVPQNTFKILSPILESTAKSLIVHSISHYQEKNEPKNVEGFEEKINKLEKDILLIQQFRDLVISSHHMDVFKK